MRSVEKLVGSMVLALSLFGCSSSSSTAGEGDASTNQDATTAEDTSEDTSPEMTVDSAVEVGPPTCRAGCPATQLCCENAVVQDGGPNPHFGLCYAASNTTFCQ
jgi:hypothetical protein